MSDNKDFHLYILLCDHKILYTGIAIDPQSRLEQHLKGHPHGAKFTRRFTQLKIVYQVKVGSRSAAQSLEIKLKQLDRADKLSIIKKQPKLTQLISYL